MNVLLHLLVPQLRVYESPCLNLQLYSLPVELHFKVVVFGYNFVLFVVFRAVLRELRREHCDLLLLILRLDQRCLQLAFELPCFCYCETRSLLALLIGKLQCSQLLFELVSVAVAGERLLSL